MLQRWVYGRVRAPGTRPVIGELVRPCTSTGYTTCDWRAALFCAVRSRPGLRRPACERSSWGAEAVASSGKTLCEWRPLRADGSVSLSPLPVS
jgi:hypothetical protein